MKKITIFALLFLSLNGCSIMPYAPTNVGVLKLPFEYSTTVEITRGDTPTFAFTITDNAGAAFDLTGYTITFSARRSINSGKTLFSKNCAITVAASGTCSTTLTTSDTDLAGECIGELSMDNGSTYLTVLKKIKIRVIEDI